MDTAIKNAYQLHKKALLLLEQQNSLLKAIADRCSACLEQKGKIMFCGNGGSASDSQHLAAELVGRFKKERRPLPALALTVNTSVLTAIGNDYGYDQIFSRQISALGKKQDLLIAMSTSGNSPNVCRAVQAAKDKAIFTVGFCGGDGGQLKDLTDLSLVIDINDTARVQEMHILAGHIICELIEDNYDG